LRKCQREDGSRIITENIGHDGLDKFILSDSSLPKPGGILSEDCRIIRNQCPSNIDRAFPGFLKMFTAIDSCLSLGKIIINEQILSLAWALISWQFSGKMLTGG
jgi:hypothetical protein